MVDHACLVRGRKDLLVVHFGVQMAERFAEVEDVDLGVARQARCGSYDRGEHQ